MENSESPNSNGTRIGMLLSFKLPFRESVGNITMSPTPLAKPDLNDEVNAGGLSSISSELYYNQSMDSEFSWGNDKLTEDASSLRQLSGEIEVEKSSIEIASAGAKTDAAGVIITRQSILDDIDESYCRHFLRGNCRYKSKCKYSHELLDCVYCKEKLPKSKVAASTHLSRCWKAAIQAGIIQRSDLRDDQY